MFCIYGDDLHKGTSIKSFVKAISLYKRETIENKMVIRSLSPYSRVTIKYLQFYSTVYLNIYESDDVIMH